MSQRKTIVIVGGGITGLTAAYYLQKEIELKQLPYDLRLIEASDRLGGKIRTHKQAGFIIERGPDSFLARKKPAVRLAEALDLKDELVRNQTGQAYILVENELHKMPMGSFMGVPTEVKPFLETTLLSTKGKLRAGLDFVLPRSNQVGDQSLGHFFRRRFGDELVENIIEPLLSGIYAGDIDEMSLLATFPNFFELEQTQRSLIKGLQKSQQAQKKPSGQTGKTSGQFFSFKNGLETIVEALKEALNPDIIQLNQSVSEIKRADGKYQINCGEATFEADAIIMTTPHQVLPNVFPTHDFFQPFSHVPANSVANVALAYDQTAMKQDVDGTGFVVSRNSDYRITACTWTHKKWKDTTPDGKALLRAYVGKPNDREIVQLSDDEIIEIVLKDIHRSMGITATPEFSVVTRWEQAMPQYTVGHKARIQQIRRQIDQHLPGVFLAGSSFEGVGIPDCIGQAEKVVEQTCDFLTSVTSS